jgi:membrane-associated protease RseP (regulator of RpoE activity)/polyhydroxyalkanoate synthesis regulator phasin
MRFSIRSLGLVFAFLLGAIPVVRADDPPADEKKVVEEKREVRVIAVPSGVKHWIGVQATPITDDALKAQLKLDEDRLIVVQVVPESPSAKAGVQTHDILIKFGDHELTSLDDLIKAVDENGEKKAKLQVLRAGEPTVLAIQPATRPEEARIVETLPQNLRVTIKDALEGKLAEAGDKELILRMLGPGIATDARAFAWTQRGGSFPNGLSLSVTKENDQPAKIVAKKDGKTYEATEGNLESLPEDVRPHVQRVLGGTAHAWAVHAGDLKAHHVDAAKIHAEVLKAVEGAKKKAAEAQDHAKAVRSRVEVLRADGGPLEDLRKEVEALRKEVQKLREKKDDDE